jgi:hypothetical protein
MFDPYGPAKPGFKERLKKILVFALAILAFGAAAVLFSLLSGIPSGRDKEKFKESKERSAALLRDVQVAVVGTGFAPRRAGVQDLYVPSLSVLISNTTSRTIEDVELRAWFEGGDSFFGRANARLFRLEPGETAEATLKCVEPTAFGTVIQGVPLWQVSKPMSYGLSVHQHLVSAEAARGVLESKILSR